MLLLTAQPLARAQAPSAPGSSLPEVMEAIERARVVTRILYVTAHPDDEPGGLLAYLARGLHADVALLSLTRGEGGQNALGPEQGPALGVVRTEELLRATRVYGTRLYFTRAADFGYTKSAQEALRVWGEPVLRDMVQVIRTFRPHVVINHWHGVRSGHGHHQAAGILTPQAVAAAADAQNFPEAGAAWKVESVLAISRGGASGPPAGFPVPLNDLSPLWGKTWSEIGLEGFLNHRTQGIAAARSSPFFRREITLIPVSGAAPSRELLARPLTALAERELRVTLEARPALANMERALIGAREAAQRQDWRRASEALSAAIAQFDRLFKPIYAKSFSDPSGEWSAASDELSQVQARLQQAVGATCGVRVEAAADRAEIVRGETFALRATLRARAECGLALDEPQVLGPAAKGGVAGTRENPATLRFEVTVDQALSSKQRDEKWRLWMEPFPPSPYGVAVAARLGEFAFDIEQPGESVQVTSTSQLTRPLTLVPAVALTLAPKSFVLLAETAQPGVAARHELRLLVRVRHYSSAKETIAVGVDVPAGWTAPAEQSVEFDGAGDQLARFDVPVPAKTVAGKFLLRAYAKRANGQVFRTSLEPLPTLPARLWAEPAETKVHVMGLRVPAGLRVGYLAAENDPIPPALRQIGVQVELLDEVALAFGELGKFDAICVGIRAYELRPDLIRANPRLLEYAAAGGTLVVQYQRESVWSQLQPAPFPARSSPNEARVADETSAVRVLVPAHPLLNFSNKIRPEDFGGWVQERGLYFWTEFDARYTPLLAMKDPTDREEFRGALVAAPLGKGTYIFTGLSFFRQLPEGVPGAYRLFVNLLSPTKRK